MPYTTEPPPAADQTPPRPRGRTQAPAEPCVTCGRPAGTPFCPHCGERRAADHPYTLRGLAGEVWDFVTPADGRTLRSLWTLVRHPGALTAAYMRGERRPYLSPLALFFFVNAVYFVFVGATGQQVFNTPLTVHRTMTAHAAVATRLVDARLAARHVSYADYERKFNAVVSTQSRTLVVAVVPGFALAAALVGVRRGRGALHHVTFAFHAMAAFLVSLMAGTALFLYPLAFAGRWLGGPRPPMVTDAQASLLLTAPLFVWLVLALRRAYGDARSAAVLKAAALMVALLQALFAYRALLFFSAFWAT